MRHRRMFGLLLGLVLLSPMATAAQEAPTAPLLVAHLHTLDLPLLRPATPPATIPPRAEEKNLLAPLLIPSLWSRKKGAIAAVASLALAVQSAPAPQFSLTFQEENPRLSLVTPLPRNLPSTMFTHGRVRGPFEQVYPRRW